ncbi:hypothetical protein BV20DRAFT_1118624 [Pilatotrama ljubarskyi]|nr:hypothetical protein BV20DRAFT_1118624 [Pilatotrama ljubarskyi]
MRMTFGGNRRTMSITFSEESRSLHKHHYPHCLFPKISPNRPVPHAPDQPSLMILAKPERRWPEGTQKVLVGLRDAEYQYMGEYILRGSAPLTVREFEALPEKVRREWGKAMRDSKEHREIRARLCIYDQLGRPASQQELAEAFASGQSYKLEPQRIVDAFNTGFLMYTRTMKCIGYDTDFQCRISAGLTTRGQR